MATWTISTSETVETDEPVHRAHIELVSGSVDVVSTDGPTRVEVEVVDGPPVLVTIEGGELRIRYERPTRIALPPWPRRGVRRARVSVAVPADTAVHLGVVDAAATVAGFTSPARVSTVSGTVVVDDLGDGVRGETVSGELQLRAVRGDVELDSVSGSLTVVGGRVDTLRADTVSGAITLDLHGHETASVQLNSVSGDLLVRTPLATLGRVRLVSTSGKIDSPEGVLESHRSPGSRRAQCNGEGPTRVEGSTVSGRILLVDQPQVPS